MKEYIGFYLEVEGQTKSPTTVRNLKSTLMKFQEFVDVSSPVEVIAKDVKRYKDRMLETSKVGTVNTQLKRIKKFFGWLTEEGIIDDNPAADIALVAEAEALPRWLDERQEDLLIRAIRKNYLGSHLAEEKKSYRELAIVMWMKDAGLRVSEVTGLKWSDIKAGERKGHAIIRGKNDQQRTVPIISDLLKVMRLYEEKHGRKGEYVFYSQKGDTISPRTIQDILKRYEGLSNGVVTIDELTPHMLRHTYGHKLAKGKMAIESIARLMGHIKRNGQPNIQQTIRYTMASQDEITDEVEKILAVGN